MAGSNRTSCFLLVDIFTWLPAVESLWVSFHWQVIFLHVQTEPMWMESAPERAEQIQLPPQPVVHSWRSDSTRYAAARHNNYRESSDSINLLILGTLFLNFLLKSFCVGRCWSTPKGSVGTSRQLQLVVIYHRPSGLLFLQPQLL